MHATLTSTLEQIILRNPIVSLGRAPDNQVTVNDPKVSPYHAQMCLEGQGFHITDLGSTNGSYINEQLLRPNIPYLLHPGDILRLGDTKFRYDASGINQFSISNNRNGDSTGRNGIRPSFPTAIVPDLSNRIPRTSGYQPSNSIAHPMSAHSMSASSPQPTNTFASLLRKENRRKLWITLGIIALAILVSFLIFTSLHSPGRTLNTYCNALKSGDYQTAYNQFAPLPGVTETEIANTRVVSCSYSSLIVLGNTATAMVTISTASGQTYTEEYALIQDSSSDWKIYNMQPISY